MAAIPAKNVLAASHDEDGAPHESDSQRAKISRQTRRPAVRGGRTGDQVPSAGAKWSPDLVLRVELGQVCHQPSRCALRGSRPEADSLTTETAPGDFTGEPNGTNESAGVLVGQCALLHPHPNRRYFLARFHTDGIQPMRSPRISCAKRCHDDVTNARKSHAGTQPILAGRRVIGTGIYRADSSVDFPAEAHDLAGNVFSELRLRLSGPVGAGVRWRSRGRPAPSPVARGTMVRELLMRSVSRCRRARRHGIRPRHRNLG